MAEKKKAKQPTIEDALFELFCFDGDIVPLMVRNEMRKEKMEEKGRTL